MEWADPSIGWFVSEGEGRIQDDAGALAWALDSETFAAVGSTRKEKA